MYEKMSTMNWNREFISGILFKYHLKMEDKTVRNETKVTL